MATGSFKRYLGPSPLIWAGAAAALPLVGICITRAPKLWPLATLVYSTGLLFAFSAVRKGKARGFTFLVTAGILYSTEVAYFLSFYVQNAGFNEAFFWHLRPDLVHAGIGQFSWAVVPAALLLLALPAGGAAVLARMSYPGKRSAPLFLLLFACGMAMSPPVRELYRYFSAPRGVGAGAALSRKVGVAGTGRPALRFTGKKRPNVVLIYAESLERRYFDESVFPDLLPRLKEIRDHSIDFSNVSQGIGAEWTVAGMVASQCGYPLAGVDGVAGNELGLLDEFMPKATCLGDLLQEDGYRLAFVGGADSRFAGKEAFLRSHGFSDVLDSRDFFPRMRAGARVNSWGLYDESMLEFALEEFVKLSSDKRPFLLSLLTLDTHHPTGNLSPSCGSYGDGRNSILNCVHCSDELISKFIERVRRSTYSKDTVIVVVSDHLAQRNTASALLSQSKMDPRLTFFINTPEGTGSKNENAGLHYDIAPTILSSIGYEIDGQMGLGRPLSLGNGYLVEEFGPDGWKDHEDELMAISRSLWDGRISLDGRGIAYDRARDLVTFGGRVFKLYQGYTSDRYQAVFVFDEKTLNLTGARFFDRQNIDQSKVIEYLLQNKDKLVLAVCRSGYLYGFADPNLDPEAMVFFFGKPESSEGRWGVLHEGLIVAPEAIERSAKSKMDAKTLEEREKICNDVREYEANHKKEGHGRG